MNVTTQTMMQGWTGPTVETAAVVFGLDTSSVDAIIQVGIPMQLRALSENEDIARKMYTSALQMSRIEVQVFYERLVNDPKLPEMSREEYEQMFGAFASTINTAAAEAAGVTASDATLVMGAALPAFKLGLKEKVEAELIDAESFSAWINENVIEETPH